MAHFFSPSKRLVLPKFRSFADTAETGELAPLEGVLLATPLADIDGLRQAWNESESVGLAGDLLGAALVTGNSGVPEVSTAAKFVVAHQDSCSAVLLDQARRVLGDHATTLGDQMVRLGAFLEENQRSRTHARIHLLRAATTRFGASPMLHVELARLYLVVASPDRAKRSMRIALALAPNNRFILRSAVRMFVHVGDPEGAFDLLYRHPRTFSDPWLTSAMLATAGLIGREKLVVKKAVHLAALGDLSAFSLAELRSGLGSIELLDGKRRQSRRLFEAALAKPNDNSLAQAQWALSVDSLFEVDPSAFDVKHNYEALALEAFNRKEWGQSIQHCESWLMDEPFSKRVALMASHVATVALEDFAVGQMFCQAGLLAHPRDPILLNNLAYAFALAGDAAEALRALDQVPISGVQDETARICLTATRGLALFRAGRIAEGRAFYLEAIDAASRAKAHGLQHLALLNYFREEVLAGQPVPDAAVDTLKAESRVDKQSPTGLLEHRVFELVEKARQGRPPAVRIVDSRSEVPALADPTKTVLRVPGGIVRLDGRTDPEGKG